MMDDLSRHLKALFRRLRDSIVVHTQTNHGGTILGDQWQDPSKTGLFSVHGVDERLAIWVMLSVNCQRRAKRFPVGAIDAHGHVHRFEHELDRPGQKIYFIDAGCADIDIQQVGTSIHLGQRLLANDVQVPGGECGCKLLLACRVDPPWAMTTSFPVPLSTVSIPVFPLLLVNVFRLIEARKLGTFVATGAAQVRVSQYGLDPLLEL